MRRSSRVLVGFGWRRSYHCSTVRSFGGSNWNEKNNIPEDQSASPAGRKDSSDISSGFGRNEVGDKAHQRSWQNSAVNEKVRPQPAAGGYGGSGTGNGDAGYGGTHFPSYQGTSGGTQSGSTTRPDQAAGSNSSSQGGRGGSGASFSTNQGGAPGTAGVSSNSKAEAKPVGYGGSSDNYRGLGGSKKP
eukprot:TRINITY_DN2655_c0_g1_i1.p1 TRINITY_DN2655_c0_g1~~TRINITY_DN2655_c0_g1_i1.p1  ORF type:complete len:188 (-),score=59.11 TRINITY_DN2655_c0_g1_i1:199-762(-)